jgi:hypothetical protein
MRLESAVLFFGKKKAGSKSHFLQPTEWSCRNLAPATRMKRKTSFPTPDDPGEMEKDLHLVHFRFLCGESAFTGMEFEFRPKPQLE